MTGDTSSKALELVNPMTGLADDKLPKKEFNAGACKLDYEKTFPQFSKQFFIGTHFCEDSLQEIKKKFFLRDVIFRPYCMFQSNQPFVCIVFSNEEKNKKERFGQVKEIGRDKDPLLVLTGRHIELPGIKVELLSTGNLIFPIYSYDKIRRVARYTLCLEDIEKALENRSEIVRILSFQVIKIIFMHSQTA